MKRTSATQRRSAATLLALLLAASAGTNLLASKGGGGGSDDSSSSSSSSSSSGSSSTSGSGSSGNTSSSGNSSTDDRKNETGDDRVTGVDSSSNSTAPSSTSTPTVTPTSRTSAEGKTEAQVNGFQAEFSVRLERRFDRTIFRAETENLNLPAGTVLTVCFGSTAIGNITLGALKFGELELDSRNGQTIPSLQGGEVLTLNQGGCGGTKLLSATLGSAPTATASSSTTVQSDSLIEAYARRVIQGFQAELHVQLEHRADRDKLTVEVENLNLGAGTRLDVCLNATRIGDLFLNALNAGELELDSRNGATVPALKTGDAIELRRGGCTGELLLSATIGAAPAAAPQDVLRTQLESETKRVIENFETEFSVHFERTPDRTKLRAEVSNLNLPATTQVTVCFAASALGNIVLNTFHFGELELDTHSGQTLPTLKAGDVIELHRSGCGASDLLLSTALALVP